MAVKIAFTKKVVVSFDFLRMEFTPAKDLSKKSKKPQDSAVKVDFEPIFFSRRRTS